MIPGFASYIICSTLTKLAILTVLYRINPSRWYRVSTCAIGFAIAAYTLTALGLLVGLCNPRHGASQACVSRGAIVHVTLNISSDLAIILLPLPTLWGLHMPRRQKMVTGGILTLGSACVPFPGVGQPPG